MNGYCKKKQLLIFLPILLSMFSSGAFICWWFSSKLDTSDDFKMLNNLKVLIKLRVMACHEVGIDIVYLFPVSTY